MSISSSGPTLTFPFTSLECVKWHVKSVKSGKRGKSIKSVKFKRPEK